MNLDNEQNKKIDKVIDRILEEKKINRTGARVFCVSCGAGKRTPLRRWHNSYICVNCWKILNAIGEEAFLERLKVPKEIIKENKK